MPKFAALASVLLLLKCTSYASPIHSNVAITALNDLAAAMDPTVDPCQDFFQYACGGWMKKNAIPKSKSSWSHFDIVNDKLTFALKEILETKNEVGISVPLKTAREMYSVCVNTSAIESYGLKPLTDYLELFGGWPMTLNHWDESSFNWKKAAGSAFTNYGMHLLVSIFNDRDSKNTTRDAIYVDQDSFYLPRSVVTDFEGNPTIATAYFTLVVESAKAVRDSLNSDVTDSDIEAQVSEVIQFESRLGNITVPEEERRDTTRMYNPMSLIELQIWTDSVHASSSQAKIDWFDFLNDIYSVINIDIPHEEMIIVAETDYLQQLVLLLDETPPRVLANYIHWRLVDALALDTNQQMADLQFAFSKVFEGVQTPTSRTRKCIDLVNELLGNAIGSVYVEKTLDVEAAAEVKVMIANLKKAFKSLVDDATWMDPETKAIARDKVDAMIEFVGYPPWITNVTELEAYYHGMPAITHSHFYNVKKIKAFIQRDELSELRTKNDPNEWNDPPTIVNAFYSEKTNTIYFPAAILQPPYFAKGRSNAMNYGAMGAMIGHEITHGFDDQGRHSDKFGNRVEWWTDETWQNYDERAECFIDQYSNYTVLNGTKLNGISTQGENIADNGGVAAALRAYRYYVAENGADSVKFENFTPEQTFFLSFAYSFCGTHTPEEESNLIEIDPHSPYRYRVIGSLSNNEDFVREFKCAPGTPMNRLNKCTIW